ncbi:flavodoxin domain-containing protein, partial [bacterium]|nr:flavodoxin domain-containing protein [bacterium]
MSSETLEAVSAATPVAHNTAQAARIIGAALEAEGLQVRLARVEEFEKKDWREVEAYDYFVLGSPAHFGQMSWEMKKFFDEAFHMIYMSP